MSPRRKHAITIRDDRAALQPGSLWWAYIRVSPGEGQRVDSQRTALDRYAAERGVSIARWWVDDGLSGSSTDGREAFDRMIEASRETPGPVAGVLVYDYSRWARNDLESVHYRSDLRMRGYAFVSVADNVPSGDISILYEAVLDFKNRKFLEDLSNNTRRGLHHIVTQEVIVNGERKRGLSGGGFPPRGYRAVSVQTGTRKDGKPRVNSYWEIDPAWQERVARARTLFAAGAPVQAIHAECRLFRSLTGYSTFWPCKTYAGVRVCGEIEILGAHPAYDSPEQQARIAARLAAAAVRHTKTRPRTKVVHMLSGLAFCALCGHTLYGRDHPQGSYYYCAGTHHRSERPDGGCTAGRVLCRVLDGAVLAVLQEQLLSEDNLWRLVEAINAERVAGAPSLTRERAQLEHEGKRLGKELGHLVAQLRDYGPSAAVANEIHRLEQERAANEARGREIAMREAATRLLAVSRAEVAALVGDLRASLESEDQELVWRIVRACVHRVEVSPGSVRVYPRWPGLIQGPELRICEYPQPDAHISVTPLERPLAEQRGRRPGPRPATVHQREVTELRAAHLTLREIGARLGVSPQAVWDAERRARRGS